MSLRDLIGKMLSVRALVIGDAMIDTYAFCRSERLCPEAPVPVLIAERLEHRLGGAANVSHQMAKLCEAPFEFFGSPRCRKTRYMVGTHMVMRVDDDKAPAADEAQKARALIEGLKDKVFDVVVLSDYNKGWLSVELCQFAVKYAKQKGIPCIVDPKGTDWSKYVGCTWICPNDREVRAAWNGIPGVLYKRGANGLRLYGPVKGDPAPIGAPIGTGRDFRDIPATAKHVYDVTGAGDTVVAVFAAALAAGGTDVQAAQLANLAAGYVVGEVGTTVCPQQKLIELVEAL